MAPTPTPFRKKRILIVDDEPDYPELLAQCLHGMYDVCVARDGVEGLEAATTFAPDLIVSDVTMPRLDGLTMAWYIRVRKGMRVPIIFLSGMQSPSDVIAGISAGARHYLAKPVDLPDLQKRIHRALGD